MPSTGTKYAKAIKECFTAEPNHVFYMVDYSALEDRVIANLSKDKNKCSIFLKNVDGHCLNSYFYFKNEIEKIMKNYLIILKDIKKKLIMVIMN